MSSRVTLPTSSGCKTPIWPCAFPQSSSSSSPWMTYPHVQMILSAIANLLVNPLPSSRPVAEGRKHAETPSLIASAAMPDEHFESGAVVHRLVPVWDLVEGDLAVENLPRFGGAVEDVGEQGLDVGAGGCGSAGESDVGCEQAAEPDGGLFVLWDADAADDAAGADDADGLLVGGHVADGFEHDVGAVAAGELADLG